MAKFKPYRYPVYLFARFGAALIFILPRRFALWIARFAGRIGYLVIARHRKATLANLRQAFGNEKTDTEIKRLAVGVFEHVAQAAVEVIQLPKYNGRNINRVVNVREVMPAYDRILAEGKGMILLMAHVGNWELLGGALTLSGIRGFAIGRRLRYEPYNRWIVNLRKSVLVDTIYRDESAKRLVEALRQNMAVGILPDQDIDSLKGIFVPFFNRPAYTSIAPVRLALLTGAPIVPSFIVRSAGDCYRFELGEVIRPVVETTREAAIEKYTQLWMREVEKVIRRHPEQWTWMHNRWKSSPDGVNKEVLQAAG